MSLSVFTLIVRTTATQFLARTLDVARLVGLPVDSWRAGDPTKTLFQAQAESLDQLDLVQTEFARSAFLDTATGDWLELRAADVYGVIKDAATFAAPSCTVDNAGGGLYVLEAGGLVVASSTTNATYTNQATVQIDPLSTGTVISLVAQLPGTVGSVTADGIDTIVAPPLVGVTIASSTAALGADEQSDPGLREECLATLGALSPAGPADAYEFVVRNSDLTTVLGITRALAVGDNSTGTVTVYAATSTAAIDSPTVALLQSAVDQYATPLCTLATVVSASPVTVPVTLALTPAQPSAQDLLEQTLTEFMAGVDLGSTVARSAIAAAVHAALGTSLVSVTVTLPAADLELDPSEFPLLGNVVLS